MSDVSDSKAKTATLRDDLMNGKGTKLLLMMASALFATAIVGSYNVADRLASMETSVDNMIENQVEIKARILYLERLNYRKALEGEEE